MIFRQFFDTVSCTYTYLLAASPGGEALLIDPVIEKVDRYIQILDELDLKLVKAVDTHVHADHISGIGELRDRTSCVTVMGKKSQVDVVSMRVEDGDQICIDGLILDVLHTPGHTDDSCCFKMADRVFTGDTLLIRGTGRTDFQNGDPYDAYNSLFNKLLKLPDDMMVYPGHDYKGEMVSSIGEEKAYNPRLQVGSADEYADIMNALGLPNPKMMDVAVPANLKLGMSQIEPEIEERTLPADEALARLGGQDAIFIDLREDNERIKNGVIPGSVHVPYQRLGEYCKSGGLLAALSTQTGQQLLLYCAYGERSALALKELRAAGFRNLRHLGGGMDAWINAAGPVEAPPANA